MRPMPLLWSVWTLPFPELSLWLILSLFLRQEDCEHSGEESIFALELEEDGEGEGSVQRTWAFE